MATHSSTDAWEIPWLLDPGGLYSLWCHKESDMTEDAYIQNRLVTKACLSLNKSLLDKLMKN